MEIFDVASTRVGWPLSPAAHTAHAGQVPAASPPASDQASNSANPAGKEHSASAAASPFHDDWNVQIARDEPANQIWINIVDQATGQVIIRSRPRRCVRPSCRCACPDLSRTCVFEV